MKHIVFYSGGIGSWYTAKRVIEQHGKENVVLLFTDTLIEDEDLYRFLDDTERDFGIPITRIADGRTPWQVFKDVRYLGNSRLAQCSHILKQKTADKWIKEHYKPDECILYLGIDWTEEHRTASPRKNWYPYPVEFPMCEEPYVAKDEMLAELTKRGIEIPRLYKLGYSHNNCSGMCVRAGQGHFINLLKTFPDRFEWLEKYEKEMQEFLGKEVSILSKTVTKGIKVIHTDDGPEEVPNKVKVPYTLTELRQKYEQEPQQIDMFDFGGCGCFVTAE